LKNLKPEGFYRDPVFGLGCHKSRYSFAVVSLFGFFFSWQSFHYFTIFSHLTPSHLHLIPFDKVSTKKFNLPNIYPKNYNNLPLSRIDPRL
jgi:hypothetical protein